MSETTAALPGTPTQAELEQIRRYTRRDFAPEELYVFPAVLCDNQIDRDGERFSRDCLRELAELFVGVTGVFDHRASAEGQHARIFAARVVEDPSRPTNCFFFNATPPTEIYTFSLHDALPIWISRTSR